MFYLHDDSRVVVVCCPAQKWTDMQESPVTVQITKAKQRAFGRFRKGPPTPNGEKWPPTR